MQTYIFNGNETAYNTTNTIFSVLGSLAVLAGSIGPSVLKNVASKYGQVSREGNVLNFHDSSANWSARIDATVHGNAKYHYNPHLHLLARSERQGGVSLSIKYFWEVIRGWF